MERTIPYFTPQSIKDPAMKNLRVINHSEDMAHFNQRIVDVCSATLGYELFEHKSDGYVIYRRLHEVGSGVILLGFLGVRVDARGRGVATALLDAVMGLRGTTQVVLHSRQGGLEFYRRYAEKRGLMFARDEEPCGEYDPPRREPKYCARIFSE